MKAVLQYIKAYLATKDASSWFLVTAGAGLITILTENIRLHGEITIQGGHHSDVVGGFLLFDFLFSTVPFVLVFAAAGALLSKSATPFLGAILGWIVVFPMLLVSSFLGLILGVVSPLIGGLFAFAAGTIFVVTGLLKKAKPNQSNLPGAKPGCQPLGRGV